MACSAQGTPKKARKVKRKSRACSSFYFMSRGLFSNNSFWHAKQSISHTTVTFYGDYVKICEDFAPNFGDKKLAVASRQRTDSHFLFHQGYSDEKQNDCRPPSTLLSVSQIENKTERLPF
jgi:hypothetical protein